MNEEIFDLIISFQTARSRSKENKRHVCFLGCTDSIRLG
ncbi:hypothetical protein T4D_5213 [Trichinella pseudospiralis]|uniref:Uncharacterized protein n=1 Tax=Trichinella pseudospiralis TaxID=6337 RepID=A0A0V1EZW0_TRIPS|nr:hypothetical protein T4D_5213 [Trichinella pseudospiralis]